jgi:hypothetical protein
MQRVEKLENKQIVENIKNKEENVIEQLTGAINPSCSATSTSNSKMIPSKCMCSIGKTYKNAKGEMPNEDGTNGPYYCN